MKNPFSKSSDSFQVFVFISFPLLIIYFFPLFLHSLTLNISLTLSHSHFISFYLSHSQFLPHFHVHSLSLPLSLSHTHYLTHTLSFSISLFLVLQLTLWPVQFKNINIKNDNFIFQFQ